MFGKLFIFSAIVAIAICFPEEKAAEWANFKAKFNKVYALSEEQQRFAVFSDNLDKIKQHNQLYDAGKATHKMGVNQFADLTQEEFLKYLKLQGPAPVKNTKNRHTAPIVKDLPDSVDYRKQGAVNPIKNQGNCGSCWAFSAIGALEINTFLNTGEKLSLSEQELVDCSGDYKNNGCNGGLMTQAYDYIMAEGIAADKDYPYNATDNECQTGVNRSSIKLYGYTELNEYSEDNLLSAVANVGAVTVAVDAKDFQLYKSGILTESDCCSVSWCLNHGVVAIGYDSENGQDYWIIRNSWGATWGEEGYIRIARGVNFCGVAAMATYPNND